MLQTSAPPVTRHDYQEMPEGPPFFQVIEGELVMSPSPNTLHQVIIRRIVVLIDQYLQKHPLGEVFMAPLDVYLGDTNVYQPDILFVANRRRGIITERGIEGAPDLVVEILSRATARYDKGSKRKVYARSGVKEFWLVDSEARTIEVYLLEKNADKPAATYSEKATLESTVLPGLQIKTASLFKSPFRK